jgi:hypothetical protein
MEGLVCYGMTYFYLGKPKKGGWDGTFSKKKRRVKGEWREESNFGLNLGFTERENPFFSRALH